jgi:hypothetical protein
MSSLVQRNLEGLVKGIRAHKKNENEYINDMIKEIKEELKSADTNKKVIALQKLTYVRCHLGIMWVDTRISHIGRRLSLVVGDYSLFETRYISFPKRRALQCLLTLILIFLLSLWVA